MSTCVYSRILNFYTLASLVVDCGDDFNDRKLRWFTSAHGFGSRNRRNKTSRYLIEGPASGSIVQCYSRFRGDWEEMAFDTQDVTSPCSGANLSPRGTTSISANHVIRLHRSWGDFVSVKRSRVQLLEVDIEKYIIGIALLSLLTLTWIVKIKIFKWKAYQFGYELFRIVFKYHFGYFSLNYNKKGIGHLCAVLASNVFYFISI